MTDVWMTRKRKEKTKAKLLSDEQHLWPVITGWGFLKEKLIAIFSKNADMTQFGNYSGPAEWCHETINVFSPLSVMVVDVFNGGKVYPDCDKWLAAIELSLFLFSAGCLCLRAFLHFERNISLLLWNPLPFIYPWYTAAAVSSLKIHIKNISVTLYCTSCDP